MSIRCERYQAGGRDPESEQYATMNPTDPGPKDGIFTLAAKLKTAIRGHARHIQEAVMCHVIANLVLFLVELPQKGFELVVAYPNL